MDTKAGGPGYALRKRKRAPLDSTAAATEEIRAAGYQAPPPGAGEVEKGAADRISNVPDAILGEIVSLLPTKEGARTQILATRWRHIWRSAPLNFDCGSLLAPRDIDPDAPWSNESDLDQAVLRILAAHQGPIRRLCIPPGHGCAEGTVGSWLLSPNLDNLQELEFCQDGSIVAQRNPLPPPASMFRFATTLRLLSIQKCYLSDHTVQGLHFPQLKHLALHCVGTSEHSLHTLIAGCPTLECLLISCIFGFRLLRINTLTIRSIGLRMLVYHTWLGELRLEELVIDNAPCLERLLHLDLFNGARVSVTTAPKLETIGSFSYAHRFFYCQFDEPMHANRSLTTVARLVKSLAVHMPVLDVDRAVDLMRCFPCLEKLYIQNEPMHALESRPTNVWRRKHQKIIGCLDIHLKTIILETYKGILAEVNFVEFFVLNARELELMTIQVESIDDKFIARQQRLLQVEKKASGGARFHFTTEKCLRNIGDIFDVRDLALTDPFVR